MKHDFDFVIIGSGFGGSVSAMRLAEKGYSVCILEQGKRFRDQDFPKTNREVQRYLWAPLFRCFGIQNLTMFKNILVLSGAGVGGGSLVYANTLLEPGESFYNSGTWSGIRDWKKELAPHYETAKKMLGVTENPRLGEQDRILKKVAGELGREDTFRPVEVGVFFSDPGQEGRLTPDPYFGGQGPDRAGCIYCGGCMVGCRHGAKNTLEKNYLWFAEKLGVKIRAERRVVDVRPIMRSHESNYDSDNIANTTNDGSFGYEVVSRSSTSLFSPQREVITAKNVIFSAGVLGTVDLLLRCKFSTKSLKKISDRLGFDVRTNSEALVGVASSTPQNKPSYSPGVAITSVFHPDDDTYVEPVVYNKGSDFMKVLAVPMIDGGAPVVRAAKLIFTMLRSPFELLKFWMAKNWAENTVILLVMQTVDNRMKLMMKRRFWNLFRLTMITADQPGAKPVPAFIPVANQVARLYSRLIGGAPQSAINEVLLNIPTTAHILGGCGIGSSRETGVVDANHRIFGYRGLYVCDGSVIPANLGVNPSLTITAMTERAMALVPAIKKQPDPGSDQTLTPVETESTS